MNVDHQAISEVVRGVRQLLIPHYGNVKFTMKSEQAHDLLTELDVQVEEYLRDTLANVYPDISFVGEETGGDRSASVKWLCDPIDGTAHFVRGTPFCTTMLALIEDGQVVMSFIYDFVNDDLYWAQKEKGAFCNDVPIQVSDRQFHQAYLGWETHLDKEENAKIYHRLVAGSHLVKLICAGWEFAMVACGKLDGRVQFDPFGKDYDFAPGSLLVSEAGGVVANIGSTEYDYTNLDFIASNKQVYQDLTEGQEALFPLNGTFLEDRLCPFVSRIRLRLGLKSSK
jgi:myo-inositol-1(or 4)-monophosphatase